MKKFLFYLPILLLLNGCKENVETTSLNESDICVTNSSQLACLQEYEASENKCSDLEEMASDTTYNLSKNATELLSLAKKLDSVSTLVIRQIDHLKITIINRSTNKTVTPIYPLIIKNSSDISPMIIDLSQIKGAKNKTEVLALEIQSLKKSMDYLRRYYMTTLSDHFGLKELNDLSEQGPKKFNDFPEELSLIEQAKRKANRHICGLGATKFKAEEVNVILSYNEYQWEAFFLDSSLPISIGNLTNLQADIFTARIKVHELFRAHLYCEGLIMRNKNK